MRQMQQNVESGVSSNMGGHHHFLQPRINSASAAVATSRGMMVENNGSINSMASSSPVTSVAGAFSYQIGMDNNMTQSGGVPVQRVIEGLPVVTLPGIVAHEVIILHLVFNTCCIFLLTLLQ